MFWSGSRRWAMRHEAARWRNGVVARAGVALLSRDGSKGL
jgi:hypothetical protein